MISPSFRQVMISPSFRQALIDLIPHWTEARYFVILLDAELLSEEEKEQIMQAITTASKIIDKQAQSQKLDTLRTILQDISKQEALERASINTDFLYFPA